MTTDTRPSASVSADVAEGVRATLAAYCHALDDGRTDDLVALFTADAVSVLPGMDPVSGTDALRALYAAVVPTGPQRHLTLNTLVTGAGDEISAVSDLVFLKHGEAGWGVARVGRYDDVLRLEDGAWRLAKRTLTFQPS